MSRKNKGFFLVEIIISVTILMVVSFGFFNLYKILKGGEESNYQSTQAAFFSEYVYHLLSKAAIPEYSLNQNFYVRTTHNVVGFTDNPIYNDCEIDFFSSPEERCSHSISYIYS